MGSKGFLTTVKLAAWTSNRETRLPLNNAPKEKVK